MNPFCFDAHTFVFDFISACDQSWFTFCTGSDDISFIGEVLVCADQVSGLLSDAYIVSSLTLCKTFDFILHLF